MERNAMKKEFLYYILYFLKRCTPKRVYIKFKKNIEKNSVDKVSVEEKRVIETFGSLNPKSTLEIEKYSNPQVTIVIPVYNQFEFTYQCVKSIIDGTSDVAYEIIIADDCSSDETKNIKDYINNVIVSRTPYNMQFLKNCNFATQKASGKYILFLNNDTRLGKGAVSTMVSLLDRDSKVGLVGGKLIYPDGKLQEAGGIVWRDGSASNFGNQDDPSIEKYNFIREVDYVSGAAMMIRKELWEMIGGFDERFAPAYYEDTDLAFEVRKRGYKVIYHPGAEVVHFEGASNGNSLFSGSKRYQVINESKFYFKWKKELKRNHYAYGTEACVVSDSLGRKYRFE